MIKQKLLLLSLLALMGSAVASFAATTPVAAAPNKVCDDTRFLTLPPWYRGLTTGGAECNIDVNSMGASDSSANLTRFLQVLALNVVEILMHIVSYVCVAFIIVGGFKYMTSTGSPDGNSKGRQTIQNALIGLVISIASIGIVNFIAGGLL